MKPRGEDRGWEVGNGWGRGKWSGDKETTVLDQQLKNKILHTFEVRVNMRENEIIQCLSCINSLCKGELYAS